MTRINCVPPTELSNKHLLAEYRELPRIFSLVRQAQDKGYVPDDYSQHSTYQLGKGHMKFFYTRLMYLLTRQESLIHELQTRGYHLKHTNPLDLAERISDAWFSDWEPDEQALSINRQRIKERS